MIGPQGLQRGMQRPSSIPTRYAGAIRIWRSTPTLQYSNTPSLWGGFDFVDSCQGGLLSRRDRMIVARQFIAWNTPKKGEPSRRDGVSRATRHIHRPWSKNVLSTESYRSLREGFFVWGHSRQ